MTHLAVLGRAGGGDTWEIISPDSYLINLNRCAGHALWCVEKKKRKETELKHDILSKACFQSNILMQKDRCYIQEYKMIVVIVTNV